MTVRLLLFLAILVGLAVLQSAFPRRRLLLGLKRWPANLGLVAIDAMLLRLLLPAGAIGIAAWAGHAGFGLLHWLALPSWAAFALAMLLLDLLIYAQHRLFHAVPLLWRLHRVHHADHEIDVTTGLRFHPLEILLSMLIKMGGVALLGAPVAAVLLFEVVLNGMAMFNHANLHLPDRVDAWLRCLLVTPDMHRVHHSQRPRETNSNYGFNLSLWDRLFGSYAAQPALGHEGMQIGLQEFPAGSAETLWQLLRLPFMHPPSPPRADF